MLNRLGNVERLIKALREADYDCLERLTTCSNLWDTMADYCIGESRDVVLENAIADLIEEAMKTGIDGVFLDGPVVYPGCCYCEACQAKFQAQHGGAIPEEERSGELDMYTCLLLERGIIHMEAELAWLDTAIEEIRSRMNNNDHLNNNDH